MDITYAINNGLTRNKTIELLGEISEKIGEFTNLEELRLSWIKTVSKEIRELKKLRVLKIAYSDFEKIPVELKMLNYIEELHLSYLKIAELPYWLYEFPNLKKVVIEHCGKLTISQKVKELKCLNELVLNGINFQNINQGLLALKDTDIETLNLTVWGNDGDYIPEEIFEITTLKNLKIFYFEGIIPSKIKKLVNLKSFSYAGSFYNKTISLPDELFQLAQLSNLRIEGVHLEMISEKISKLSTLSSLIIESYGEIEIPTNIWELTKLKYLKLHGFTLPESSRKIPQGIRKLTELKKIELSNIYNLERIPDEISQLHNLESLVIKEVRNTIIPDIFQNLKQLKEIIIDHSSFKSIPLSFNELRSIEKIDILSLEKIRIPEGLSFSKGLKFLSLIRVAENAGNNLLDSISNVEELSYFKYLGCTLHLRQGMPFQQKLKNLEFSIANEVQNLEYLKNYIQLESLIINGNSFIKEIPKAIYDLKELKKLELRNTYISVIPDDIANLENLEELNIDSMNSSSEIKYISDKIIGLSKLVYLSVFVGNKVNEKKALGIMNKETFEYLDENGILSFQDEDND